MGKNKIRRFDENLTFQHVVQPSFSDVFGKDLSYKGHWNELLFKREAPLILELGCGRGEYTLGLAQMFPEKNFIGVDIKGARIWRGAKNAIELGLKNVGFLRTHVDHISRCFGPNEIDEIWLTFSDPQLKKARKRLTSPLFLDRYRQILKPNGVIHLKTDSPVLFEYTLEQIAEQKLPVFEKSDNVYADLIHRVSDQERSLLNIRTYYESMWLEEGRTIHYLRFGLI
jgi:tRNA (guanine-N7-)-methyltransferase